MARTLPKCQVHENQRKAEQLFQTKGDKRHKFNVNLGLEHRSGKQFL